jgi:hypothetical protein
MISGTTSEYKTGASLIGGGYNCSISVDNSNHPFIGDGSYIYKTIISGKNSVITGGNSSSSISDTQRIKDDAADTFFIEKSRGMIDKTIVKYSPLDNKWKTYRGGIYSKVDDIKMNNISAESRVYDVHGKKIGVFLVNSGKTKIKKEIEIG